MTIQVSESANKDLPIIARLLNEEYKGSYEFIPFSEERILSEIRKRRLKVRIARENDKVLGVIGTHIHAEEHLEEHISWLAACKGRNQRFIENILVNEIEKNANGGVVLVMIDEGNPKIDDWIKRGYVLCPGFLRMSAKLDCLKPIPELAEGTKLRSLRHDEEEKLVAVINAGFGWQRLEPGTLEIWKSDDPPFSEDWVQVAEIGERIVSAVVAKPDTDYVKYLHFKRGHLGPAATLPEFRNQHIASALTAKATNFLFEKGMNSVRLGTSEENISSISLLRNLGFRVDIIRKGLRKELKNI
ncbi:GNAT family N-acetyltransferase [Candidatus Bathyarchaeota archaeon]|nr:GNAT family N-acetyltransferase [Candidatus Bathyarchaeota archaeon]